MIENSDHIAPPSYYSTVMTAAKKISAGQHCGIASFSGQEAVDSFNEHSKDTKKAKLLDESGNITTEIQHAVAVLVLEPNNPSSHIYFNTRFNQPV